MPDILGRLRPRPERRPPPTRESALRIRDWPIDQRPRERLLAGGAAALSDAELLAVLLRTGTAGKHAVELARELLAESGGLRGLVCADAATAPRSAGLGPARRAQLQAAVELARRSLREELRSRDVLASPAAVGLRRSPSASEPAR